MRRWSARHEFADVSHTRCRKDMCSAAAMMGPMETLETDYLVIGAGSQPFYFQTPGNDTWGRASETAAED